LNLRRLELRDVLVIGGGPTGSRVAFRLAGLGYSVAVVEQKTGLAEPVCCTGIISQECASAFGIEEGVIYRRANCARIFSPSGKQIYLWRPEPQACIVNRTAFNVALAHRAESMGAEYVLGGRVGDIEVGRDRVRLVVTGREDNGLLEAKVVVVATGFASKLTEKLGLGGFRDFVMGAQAEVETVGIEEIEIYLGQEVAPGFFAWLVPTSPSRALAGLLSRKSPGLYLKKFLAFLLAQGKIASADVKPRYGGIALKPLARTCGDRILVVGTAAGQVKPTTGGGIYYGLLCADAAADTLHQALQSGNLFSRGLMSYERSWKRKLVQDLRVGYWARQFYEHLSDNRIDGIFDIIQSNGIVEAFLQDENLSFDWHGRAVLRVVGHRALSRVIETMRIPLPKRIKKISGIEIDK
jgi:geranylgeranyl reductase family protein